MMDSRSELLAGTVFVKSRWRYKKRYAVACTGREPFGVETSNSEDRQAHLLIYRSGSSDVIERINFSVVLGVSAGPSGITLRLPDSFHDVRFRTKRRSGNKQWMKACTLLNAFPNYLIPNPPEAHRSLLRAELATLSTQYCEIYKAHDAWTVHVLSGSIAEAWDIVGLQIVTIGKENSMLNVIHPTTGRTRLKVGRHDILRCGFWNSMICLEISVGLHGILWMDCFQDQVKEIRDKIHNFAFYGLEARLPPLPQFPSFFSDLPFSPRCYFDRLQRSRSASLSSQSSDRSDALSCSLRLEEPVAPQLDLTTHPSFIPIKFTSPSAKYLSHSPVNHKTELVRREKKRRSILLEPSNPPDGESTEPCGYSEPVSTKHCVATSGLTVRQPVEYCTPVSRDESYIVMQAANLSTS